MSGKRWTKPEAIEIKMDAEISSYQEDGEGPRKDGPPFAQSEQRAETKPDATNVARRMVA